MSYPLVTLQQAIYAQLSGDAALQNLVNGIYDQPPADAVFPYIAIEQISTQDWRFRGGRGVRAQLMLRVYSRYHGKSECHSILARMDALLHEASLTVSGLSVAQMRTRGCEVQTLPDQRTTRGTLELMIDAYSA